MMKHSLRPRAISCCLNWKPIPLRAGTPVSQQASMGWGRQLHGKASRTATTCWQQHMNLRIHCVSSSGAVGRHIDLMWHSQSCFPVLQALFCTIDSACCCSCHHACPGAAQKESWKSPTNQKQQDTSLLSLDLCGML